MTDTSTSSQNLSPSNGRTNDTQHQIRSLSKRLDRLQELVQDLPGQLAPILSSSRPPSSASDGALRVQEDIGSGIVVEDVDWIANLLVPFTSSVKDELMAIRSDVQRIEAAQKATAPRTPLPSSRPATSASRVAPEAAVIIKDANADAAQAGQVQSHSVLPSRPVKPRVATSGGQPSAQSGPESPRPSRLENNVSYPGRPKPSHPETSPSSSEAAPPTECRLGPERMGVRMTHSIEELSDLPSFAYIIEVEPLPISSDSDLQAIFILETNPDLKVNKFAAIGPGYARVTIDRAQESAAFKWPDFSQVTETPTKAEAVTAVEMFIRHPHKTAVHFGGTFRHQLVNKSQLHAGKALTSRKELTHVNEEYAHIGDKLTATGMHREDANFRSANVVDLGIKIWMLVHVEDNARFEKAIEEQFGRKPCDQWLRHLCLLLAPSWFQEHSISYTLIIQGPGQMVVTDKGQYHQVLNYSACFARSINFLFAWEKMSSLESPGIAVCDECGLKNLRHFPQHHVRAVSPLPQSDDDETTGTTAKKRKRAGDINSVSYKRAKSTAASTDAASSTRQSARIAKKTGNTAAALNGDSGVDVASDSDDDLGPTGRNGAGAEAAMPVPVDRLVVVPSPAAEEGIADNILQMAYAICSRDAVKQFAAVVNHWRKPQLLAHCAPENDVPPDTSPETHGLIQTCKQVHKSIKREGAEAVLSRHCYVQFSRAYILCRRGADRIDDAVLREVKAVTGLKGYTLDYYRKKGTAWDTVCGPFGEGLLVFVLCDRVTLSPFGVTAKFYTGMSDEDRAQFYQLIQCSFVEKMCEAAKAWLEAVDGKRTIRFRWEDHDVDWDSLDEAGILSEMEFYDPEKQ